MQQLKSKAKISGIIFLFAMTLSVIGFFIDGDPREPSVALNLFEISMMSLILFVLMSIPFWIVVGLSRLFGRTQA